ncbi:lmo0937 family membrane protein [Cellulophaga sp. L1A9]|uniref:lmo0937 family membrane protein n=1 Tax=Cellulophaga sp. L1A9 TaxID=2686362 RepID=UPI00131BDB56
MLKYLKILAAIVLALWAIGFFFFDFGLIIHLVLVMAALLLIISVLKENNY